MNQQADVPAYVEAMRDDHLAKQLEVEQLEAELRVKRAELSKLGRALGSLDPNWSANHKPKTRKPSTGHRKDGSYAISEEKLDAVLEYVRAHHTSGTFTASELPPDELGMSDATRSAAVRVLQERGLFRLDRKAGQAKFYALND
jgi:hypothetical protein